MSQERPTPNVWHSYLIWFLASVFYAYQYVIRVLPNVIMPQITEKFQADAGDFGQFSSAYYIGYALFHVPLGLMLDRMGPRMLLSGCVLLTALGVAPLLYAEHWIYAVVGRFLVGIGSSAAILGCFKIIRMSFPAARFTRMLGFSVTIGVLGGIYGGQPLYMLMAAFGWQHVITSTILLGAALALTLFLCVPATPPITGPAPVLLKDIGGLMKNPRVISLCIFGGLMVAPVEGFADAWGTSFLQAVYGFDPAISARLPSYIFLGMSLGATALSYLAEKTNAYYGVIASAAFLMCAGFSALLGGYIHTHEAIALLLFGIGVLCAYQIPLIYKVSTFVPDHLTTTATGFTNMVLMLFGAFYHPIIGQAVLLCWDGRMEQGLPLYSPEAYAQGLSVIPLGLGTAAVGVLVLWILDRPRNHAQPLR